MMYPEAAAMDHFLVGGVSDYYQILLGPFYGRSPFSHLYLLLMPPRETSYHNRGKESEKCR